MDEKMGCPILPDFGSVQKAWNGVMPAGANGPRNAPKDPQMQFWPQAKLFLAYSIEEAYRSASHCA